MTLTVVPAGAPQPPPRSKLDEDALRLREYAEDHRDDGWTHPEVEAAYGWSGGWFRIVLRRLREILAENDENIVCHTNEDDPNGPWLYWLTSDPEHTLPWHANRLDDSETRLETMANVARSAMRAYPARTRNGRRARIIYTAAQHALDNLRLLDDQAV